MAWIEVWDVLANELLEAFGDRPSVEIVSAPDKTPRLRISYWGADGISTAEIELTLNEWDELNDRVEAAIGNAYDDGVGPCGARNTTLAAIWRERKRMGQPIQSNQLSVVDQVRDAYGDHTEESAQLLLAKLRRERRHRSMIGDA